jgi:glutamate 5-kinase
MQRIVIKIGTQVITTPDGALDEAVLASLVAQVDTLKQAGVEVVLVSSGAVAAGRPQISADKLPKTPIAARQLLAAVGQVELMSIYARLFRTRGYLCAQVLATREDFRDRQHYLSMRDCLGVMLHEEIIPVVNENDVVAINELMFTDNDELAGLIASMLNADALFILSGVAGLYDRNPAEPGAQLIPVVDERLGDLTPYANAHTGRSQFGRGGMHTKCRVAQKMARLGIRTYLAHGHADQVIERLWHGEALGTYFPPAKKAKAVKQWVAQGVGAEQAAVVINPGAIAALRSTDQATSLLPIGVIAVVGQWEKGALIAIQGPNEEAIGFGVAQCSADEARAQQGQAAASPIIHYDYLYLEGAQ